MAILLLLLGSVVAAVLGRRSPRGAVLGSSFAQVAALVLAGVEALARLVGGGKPALGLVAPFTLSGLELDPLGAVFVLALVLAGIPIAVYAPGYLAGGHQRLSGSWQQTALPLLEASILGVLIARDALWLLVAWELMTATATVLVLADGHKPEVRRAALLYVIMSHVGALLGILAILILARGAPDLGFASLRAAGAALTPGARAAVLLLALVGFGTKSGIVPFHVWLPEAHPAAPSHVSAILSGVLVKSALYVVLRVTLDLAGPLPGWFGFLLIAVGLASAVLGVLYALIQHDLKRLLAFSTVENIGIVYLGIGVAVVARDGGSPAVAGIAFAGALLHALNHAVFKTLLFLCTGSLQSAAHGRNLEDLGGLLRRMPATGLAFLIGSLTISALPPLSGFASEWTIIQAVIAASRSDVVWLDRAVPIIISGLALTGALAAATFVKAFGIAFLGLPRSEKAEHAVEVGSWRRAAQGTLALLCVAMGVGAPLLLPLVSAGGAPLGIARVVPQASAFVLAGSPVATTSPFAIAVALALTIGVLVLATRRSRRDARPSMTWACGLEKVEPRMQYTSSAFAKPIRLVFRRLFQPSREISPDEGTPPYFVRRYVTSGSILAIFDRFLYEPLVVTVTWIARRVEALSSPSLEAGLLFTLLVFCAALWWSL